jgi:hypothetical protein
MSKQKTGLVAKPNSIQSPAGRAFWQQKDRPFGKHSGARCENKAIIASSNLRAQLEASRPELARIAQAVYDDWQQDEEGIDEVYGGGGICDAIAEEIAVHLSQLGIDTIDGGQDGDDHAFLIAYNDTEAYEVDIPPGVYEYGSGYSWTKKRDVTITADDVYIGKVDQDILDQILKEREEGF